MTVNGEPISAAQLLGVLVVVALVIAALVAFFGSWRR